MKPRPLTSHIKRSNLNHSPEFIKLKNTENKQLYHLQKAKADPLSDKLQIANIQTKESNASDNSTSASLNNLKSTITFLTPQSHEALKRSIFNDSNKNITSALKRQNTSSSLHLKVNSLAAEICEAKLEDEEALKRNYEEFKRDFYRLVFDKKKNLIYTKPSDITKLCPKETSVSSIESFSTERFLNQMENKYKNLQSEKFIIQSHPESPINNLISKPNYQKGKAHIEEIRKKSLNILNMNLKTYTNQKVVDEARIQIEKVIIETREILDKVTIENTSLKDELKNTKVKLEDITSENGIIQRKNQLLVKELEELKEKNELLTKNMSTLERFIPMFNTLKDKFPTEDIKGIMNKYDKLETYCINHVKRINDLEEEIRSIKEEKNLILKDIQTKKYELRDFEIEKNKALSDMRNELDKKETILEQQKNRQDDYNLLMKKILDIYFKWTQKVKIFNIGEIKADLKDPLEILDVMNKIIEISTPEYLQEKFRKVIVSANMLMRRCFPEYINEKFDADKIYERISKYIDDLENELKRLKNSNDITKRASSKKSSK